MPPNATPNPAGLEYLGSNQVRQLRVHHGRHSADADRPESVLTAILPCVCAGTQNRKQHRLQQDNGDAVEKRDRRARPDAERRAMPHLFLIARAEAAGNETGTAQAKEIGEAGQQHEAWHGDGRRRPCSGSLSLPMKNVSAML